jgi:putative Ca2+/H+ antiporter (TMEM165/GDT1 family)
LVFVAELGDKSQLLALSFGARHKLLPVLVGLVLGEAAVNVLSVTVGGAVGAALPERPIEIAGGLLFLGFAGWTIYRDDDGDDDDVAVRTGRSVVVSVGLAIAVAELGDKTMLATATLASRGEPLLTWLGATAGITLAGVIGVSIGRLLGARIPPRATQIGSAVLFLLFGVALLAGVG